MPFSNTDQPTTTRTDASTEEAQHMLTLMHSVGQASVPWIFSPFDGQTTTGPSKAYLLAGRDKHSVIIWSLATTATQVADTPPASFSLEVWGSHTNRPGSYIKAATITTTGETTISAEYAFVVFYLASITTPGSGLRVTVRSYRGG